ncbi:MAG: hypothetical protein LW850_29660 [Planctomycetaceae bacterium]|nr:hypothetical protein [Planctomycetaceae bacterium]MCE2814575.1 hypothetical protein [Planctomycetaceae bacterium]
MLESSSIVSKSLQGVFILPSGHLQARRAGTPSAGGVNHRYEALPPSE